MNALHEIFGKSCSVNFSDERVSGSGKIQQNVNQSRTQHGFFHCFCFYNYLHDIIGRPAFIKYSECYPKVINKPQHEIHTDIHWVSASLRIEPNEFINFHN